jgi:catechol 2,3-dioxygenase
VIDPGASIGAVHLTIVDLDRSVRFYQTHLGFTQHDRDDRTARLGASGSGDDVLLVLTQSESAPRARGTTGLYHFAILVPTRADLARALQRLIDTRTVMQGAADHGVSEALYLADPDGNGIEIYRDRRREEWPIVAGELRMFTLPLDLDDLRAEAGQVSARGVRLQPDRDDVLPRGTIIGHVHLHVAHLDAAERFYADVLGFQITQRYGPSALFVSAGGYHHHVGLNTWAGVGAPPPPEGAIGLRHFEVTLSSDAALADVTGRIRAAGLRIEGADAGLFVRDPSNNAVMFRVS